MANGIQHCCNPLINYTFYETEFPIRNNNSIEIGARID